MKVILTQDVKAQGKRGDVINVSDGYATNYLFKNNLAVPASAGNVNVNNARKKAEADKIAADTAAAKELAKKLEALTLNVKLEVGASGKAFGAVSVSQIDDELKKNGFEIDRKKIELDTIKRVGAYFVNIKLYKGVTAKVKLMVQPK